jgi:uncharacterized membrane protein YedE/YeeE
MNTAAWRILTGVLTGLIFGVGIVISGMMNPAKVQNFFDLAGTWDPSLAFVMVGGLAVTALGYRFVLGGTRPLFEPKFDIPSRRTIDRELVGGSVLFGIGWGVVGFCPGGLVPALGLGRPEPWIFLAGMVLGIVATRMARAAIGTRTAQQAARGSTAIGA